MIRHYVVEGVMAFEIGVMFYFIAINAVYLLFAVVAFFRLIQNRRRWTPRALHVIMRSPATPAISVIVPAYNEEASIEQSVRSLLLLNYPQHEVIVVNDGSKDATLKRTIDAFGLLNAPLASEQPLATKPVGGLYRSLDHPELVVVDKENGGKADAINAGINAARYPIVCVIDADSILEEHALERAVLPFIEDPSTVAAGGIIRVVNGCLIDAGRVVRVGPPASWLARFQVVEYLRAFLVGRVAMSAMNSLLIISGAFGVFNRKAVIEVGGFRRDTIGEDMEVIVRLHRQLSDRGVPYRIVFQPDPVCWTEVPETTRILASQRNRWQRGTCQVLSYHLAMLGRPRYGSIGLFAVPFYLIFEAAGPVIETLGYLVTLIGWASGVLSVVYAQLLFLVSVVFGTFISLTSVLLEEISFRRYPKLHHLLVFTACGVLENFGYRQLTAWWRLGGVVDFLRKRQGWGVTTRRGFEQA